MLNVSRYLVGIKVFEYDFLSVDHKAHLSFYHYEGSRYIRAFVLSDVLDYLVGVDDGFGFEEHGRCGDAHDGVERAD